MKSVSRIFNYQSHSNIHKSTISTCKLETKTFSSIISSHSNQYYNIKHKNYYQSHNHINNSNNFTIPNKHYQIYNHANSNYLTNIKRYQHTNTESILNESNDINHNNKSKAPRIIKLGLPKFDPSRIINTRRTSALYDSQFNKPKFESISTNEDKNDENIENKFTSKELKEQKARLKWLNSKYKRLKTEYEISHEIKNRFNKIISKKLESEKPEHHKIFSRIKFEPSFPNEFKPTDISKLDPTPRRTPVPWDRLRTGVIAQKIGMLGMFDIHGIQHTITICRVDALEVVQLKTDRNTRRGTYSLQLGYGSQKIRRINWSKLGHFVKQGISPKLKLMEFQVGKDCLLPVGTEITCRHFLTGQYVDVQGITKGKGFQGTMKRWKHQGGPATHGSTKFHRKRGSSGGSGDPGKVWKGKKMPGNMGNKRKTIISLRIFRIEPKQNLIYIIGRIPGYNGNYLKIRDAHFLPPKNPPMPTFFPDPNEETLPEFTQWVPKTENVWYENETDPEVWKDRVSPDLL